MPTRLSNQAGRLAYDGQPCKLLGANAYSLYSRLVSNSTPSAYIEVLDRLSAAGCKVVRVFGDGFSPGSGLGLWETAPATAIAAATTLFDAAHARGMSLFWCIHWHVLGVPLWKAEANTALLSGSTASRTYLKLVIDTVVPQFKNHPALAGWECANEIPGLFVTNGLTVANATALQNDIRTWINAQDSGAFISSGSSTHDLTAIPAQNGSYPDGGLQSLAAMHSGWNSQSSHIYADRPTAVGLNGSNFRAWLNRVCGAARALGQPMVIGEFGGGAADAATSEIQIRQMVAGFAESDFAQLALLWNCDVSDYSANKAEYIFNGTTRQYVFDLLNQHRAMLPTTSGKAAALPVI